MAFCSPDSFSQTFHWAKNMGSASNFSGENSIAVSTDQHGNIYTAGLFEQSFDIDPGAGIYTIPSISTGTGSFIQKLDFNGQFVWAKTFNGTASVTIDHMTFDSNNNLYIIGGYTGTADFDPGVPVYSMSTPYLTSFILKLDSAGNFMWATQFISTFLSYNRAMSVCIDHSNQILITGFFTGTNDFDPGGPVSNLTSIGGRDIFTCKLDTTGNLIWVKQIGSTLDDEGWSVAAGSMNAVITTGIFKGSADFNPNGGNYTLNASAGKDMYVSALDSNGNFVWANSLQGSGDERVHKLKIDASENILLCGYFLGSLDVDPGVGVNQLNAVSGTNDAFLLKLSPSGNYLWAKHIGGAQYDEAKSVDIDSNGNVFCTGSFTGTVNFDPGVSNYTLNSALSTNIFVTKHNSAGVLQWVADLGSNANQVASDIHLDGFGALILTGLTLGVSDFNPSDTVVFNITSNGGYDVYVAKLQANCGITSYASVNACDSLVFNGSTMYSDSFVVQNYSTAGGCDSHFVYQIALHPSFNMTYAQSGCDSLQFGNQTILSSGIYTNTFTSISGCDSVVTLNASIHQSYQNSQTVSACDSFSFMGFTYFASGVYPVNLTSTYGCDSIVTLLLTIYPSSMALHVISECDSFSYNGITYTLSGNYLQNYVSVYGCDSSIAIDLTIHQSSTNSIIQNTCDSYTLNGQTYTISGMYMQQVLNAAGCDSTITLDLSIQYATSSTSIQTGCDFFVLNGITYTVSGMYTQPFINSVGCDSAVNLTLTINHADVSVSQTGSLLTSNANSATYQWITCNPFALINGATNQSYTATANADYAVIVTQNSCTDTSICKTVTGVGVDEFSTEHRISIFPNPGDGFFWIELPTSLSGATVHVLDATGIELVHLRNIQGTKVPLNLTGFANGVYIVVISENGFHYCKRITLFR